MKPRAVFLERLNWQTFTWLSKEKREKDLELKGKMFYTLIPQKYTG